MPFYEWSLLAGCKYTVALVLHNVARVYLVSANKDGYLMCTSLSR